MYEHIRELLLSRDLGNEVYILMLFKAFYLAVVLLLLFFKKKEMKVFKQLTRSE